MLRELTPTELTAQQPAPLLVDVRRSEELEAGVIAGSLHVPLHALQLQIRDLVTNLRQPIVIYCAHGQRSLAAAAIMQQLGYADVASLAGGIAQWEVEGLPLVYVNSSPQTILSEAQRRRYRRQLSLAEVGESGQLRLLAARVLIVGAGGLGSPVALYLAAAGVGTLGIIDADLVDESNLQRQVLHTTPRLGTAKTESARQALTALNPETKIKTFQERLTTANALDLCNDFDLIVDGSDNFGTRYLINDSCVRLNRPNVHGSVLRFSGQVTVFKSPGPCYRCLYPAPPPPEVAPTCAEAGVLGVVPGVIGMLQASEALKLILGKGEPLIGRLLHYDALKAEFRTLKIERDPHCSFCSIASSRT